MIGADLVMGKTVIYGQNLSPSVLDGLLASTAIPPWFAPVAKDAQLIIDGGILSNLPIEPALTLGATEIIALDLMNDPASLHENAFDATQQFELVCGAEKRFDRLSTFTGFRLLFPPL